MQYGILDWILEQTKDISGKTREIPIKSVVDLIITNQCQLLGCDKPHSHTRCWPSGRLDEGYMGTLDCLCDFSVHLKLFQNKKFISKKAHPKESRKQKRLEGSSSACSEFQSPVMWPWASCLVFVSLISFPLKWGCWYPPPRGVGG